MTPEPFVSADAAAEFIGIERRHLLALARRGIAGAYPLDPERQRKTWIFRLSELAGAIAMKKPPLSTTSDNHKPDQRTIRSAVSRA
jgi:hypothetical protein